MNNHKIITTFLPKQIGIRNLDIVLPVLQKSNLIVYGEIHGIKENANIVYTLVKKTCIQRLAIEASPTVFDFINSVKINSYDFSLVDEAKTILGIDGSLPTLCIMGQWHTQPKVVTDGETRHESALYRLRKTKPNVPFIHNIYRQGELFNDGKIIELPDNPAVSSCYEIVQKTDIDFDLHVPEATRISLC